MRVSVAVAQIPVCWSVSRNTATVVEIVGQVEAGTVLVLPECALSGYDDQLSRLDDLDPGVVKRVDHRPDLFGGEAVPHRVRPVPERGIGDAHISRRRAHAITPTAPAATASRSPTRAAAAVMMSRLPAQGGR